MFLTTRQKTIQRFARKAVGVATILGCVAALALGATTVLLADGHGSRVMAQSQGIIPTPLNQFRRNLIPSQLPPLSEALQPASIAAAVKARHARVGRAVDPYRCEINWTLSFGRTPQPQCLLVNYAGAVWQSVTPEEACAIQTGSPRWQPQNPQILCLR